MSNVASRSRRRRLTNEECRILLAAQEERLFLNSNGRYEIEDEVRPDRRTRENLAKRGLVQMPYRSSHYRITAKGKRALETEFSHRAQERRAHA